MDTADLRHQLADYLDAVREFNQCVMLIDSGVFRFPDYHALITHPEAILKLENQFIGELAHLLNEINSALNHARQWRAHLENLATNLYFSPIDKRALFEKKQKAVRLLAQDDIKTRIQASSDGLTYLRWIAADTGLELEQLLIEMRNLGVTRQGLRNLFSKYQSPELSRWEKALDAWLDVDLDALITALQGFLDEASNADFNRALHALASYIDVIVNLLSQFSAISASFNFLSLEWMSKIQIQFDLLTEASVALHELLSQRIQVGNLYIDHELAILNAILPDEINPAEWFVMFTKHPTKSAHELLPQEIRFDALSYALHQAETALVSMDDQLQIGEYLLKSVEVLPELLKSSIVAKFLDADKQRLEIFRTGRLDLFRRLRQMREMASSINVL
ncbi:MAG: hypothetical protein ACFE9D_07995 [Promethearchaeota archaeon]